MRLNFLIFGLVAQMVDRRLGMAEAPGSNPGQSTLILSRYIEYLLVYKRFEMGNLLKPI